MSRPRPNGPPAGPLPPPPAGDTDPALMAIATWTSEVAGAIAADGFAAFSVTPTAERQLALHLSGGMPGDGLLAAFQAGGCASEAARHALAASTPFWWGERGAAAPLAALPAAAHARWAGLGVAGLGLPCATERGQCGVFLFWGARIAPEPDQLAPLHARCFALFEGLMAAVLRLSGRAVPRLTKRELECLRLTARGMTSKAIAAHSKRSVHTTDQHLSKAAESLDAVNRTHAVAKAIRLGLLD